MNDLITRLRKAAKVQWQVSSGTSDIESFMEWEAADALELAQEDFAALVWIYNQGYQSGHHDTVEGMFTDVLPVDMESYHDDVVIDLIEGRGIVNWAKNQLSDEDKN